MASFGNINGFSLNSPAQFVMSGNATQTIAIIREADTDSGSINTSQWALARDPATYNITFSNRTPLTAYTIAYSDVSMSHGSITDSTTVATGGATFAGGIGISKSLSVNRTIRIKDTGSNYLTLQTPAALAGSITLTLPGTVGALNSVLTSDGTGVLSFQLLNNGTLNPRGYITLSYPPSLSVTSIVFATITKWIFPGTTTFGALSAIHCLCQCTSLLGGAGIQVQMVTLPGGVVFAGPNTLSLTNADGILSLTIVPANVPTTEQECGLQYARVSGLITDTVFVHFVTIR
jgi:hypothetical protein